DDLGEIVLCNGKPPGVKAEPVVLDPDHLGGRSRCALGVAPDEDGCLDIGVRPENPARKFDNCFERVAINEKLTHESRSTRVRRQYAARHDNRRTTALGKSLRHRLHEEQFSLAGAALELTRNLV